MTWCSGRRRRFATKTTGRASTGRCPARRDDRALVRRRGGEARRFGELTAVGVAQAEELLGTELAGPVDVFVYDSREDFFGALGPGAREWTGAAAYSELRTIFMWLGGGSPAYLEVAMVHEVTHVVFYDATDNPFHEPARWLNEGIATWSESGDAGEQRGIVEFEAGGGGLFSFEAISEQFPIGESEGQLSYAQGTTMIDDDHRPLRPRGHRAHRGRLPRRRVRRGGARGGHWRRCRRAVCRVLRRIRGG